MDYKKEILVALSKASGVEENLLELEVPNDINHGDFSSNVAFKTSNPKSGANEILSRLSKDKDLEKIVSKIEIAGPGFINFYLSNSSLNNEIKEVLEKGDDYGKSEIGKGQTVIIDYSSPNIAKRFSVGHLRSTIIGQALYNIYTFLGYSVIGDNHLGDWGTQFGVLIYMVEKNNLNPDDLTVDDWEKLYVEFHSELEKNPELKDEARDAFKRLEEKDENARKIWKSALDTSLNDYQKIYDLLDVKIDFAYGESFYEDKMPEAIQKAIEAKVAQKNGEALAIEFEKYNLPSNLLVKSNGTTTYLARDLALMYFRKQTWNPDLQIFEVGADQKLYFQQVFALAEMLGIFNLNQLKHIAHGMIRLPEGKMSTRKGRTIKLDEILNEAINKAEILGNKDVAKAVGIGAVKYNDLKREPTREYVFDWEDILNMKGNSGPYLQYTYARIQSLIQKVDDENIDFENNKINDFSDKEVLIARKIAQFSGVLLIAGKNYSPNLICNYLYDLSSTFNSFYNDEKIIGSTREKERIALSKATSQVLKNGLKLLGIKTVEKM